MKTELDRIKEINKITCTKCKKAKGVRPDILKKRVIKFGSLDLLLKSYVCAKCRKKHEVNAVGVDKPPEAVWDSSDAFWKQPGYVFPGSPDAPKPTKYSEADYADITLTTCLMPTTKLDGRCAICPHYAYCKLTDNKGNLHKLQDQVEINEQGHVIRRAKKAKAQYTDEADEVVESVKKVKKTKGRPKGSKNKKKKK